MRDFDWVKFAVWAVVIVACLVAWWGVAEMVTS